MIDDLMQALKTVKAVCERHQNDGDGCKKCPMLLSSVEACGVMESQPDDWNITEPTVRVMG